jgi:uncharacterized protein
MIRRLLGQGERRLLYYSFDLEREPSAIPAVIERAKAIAGEGDGPWYLFLDEVTALPDWQRGVKFAWDHGLIRDDFVLCTGSSSHRMGTEQLPGRRGGGKNFLQLPVSFRDFCRVVAGMELPAGTLAVEDWIRGDPPAVAKKLHLRLARLNDALGTYLRVGGFPAALRDDRATGSVSAATIDALWALIANEIRSARLDPAAALKLVERVGASLGSTLSWQSAAAAMGVASHHTAQGYVRSLAESFTLLVVYHWSVGGGFEPQKQRKVYFLDPLFAHVPSAALGLPGMASDDGMLEGVVASALFRSAGEHLVQVDPTLGALGYWRSREGREIDFVVDAFSEGARGRIPVEVKGDGATAVRSAVTSIERSFGRGIVLTRTRLDLSGPARLVPASVFLAALPERTERRMSTL